MKRKEWKRIAYPKERYHSLSTSVAFISIAYGWFIMHYQGYFLGILHPSALGVSANAVGIALVLLGLLKIMGVATGNKHLRRLSIIALTFVWGGLLTINFFYYALGAGYPNPLWLFQARVVYDCTILASKGRFE